MTNFVVIIPAFGAGYKETKPTVSLRTETGKWQLISGRTHPSKYSAKQEAKNFVNQQDDNSIQTKVLRLVDVVA